MSNSHPARMLFSILIGIHLILMTSTFSSRLQICSGISFGGDIETHALTNRKIEFYWFAQIATSTQFSFFIVTLVNCSPMEPLARSDSSSRRSSRSRLSQPDYTNRNTNFYRPLDCDDPENVAYHLRQIRTSAIDLGFTGIFDVALEATRSEVQEFRDDKLKFIENGKLIKLYRFCRPSGSHGMIPVGTLLCCEVCDAAAEVYAQEWARLLSYSGFRTPFGKFAVD
jgi:hypothetical protein